MVDFILETDFPSTIINYVLRGGAVWYVNATITGIQETDVVVDKTPTQIIDAYKAGYIVYAKVSMSITGSVQLVPLSSVFMDGVNSFAFTSCGLKREAKAIVAFVLEYDGNDFRYATRQINS